MSRTLRCVCTLHSGLHGMHHKTKTERTQPVSLPRLYRSNLYIKKQPNPLQSRTPKSMIRKGRKKKKTPVLSYGKYWGQKEKEKEGKKRGKKTTQRTFTNRTTTPPQIHTDHNLYIYIPSLYTFSPHTSLIPDLTVPLNTLANTDSVLLDILLDPGSVESIVPVCVLLDRIHLLQGSSDIVREDHSHPGDVSNRQGAVRNRRVRAKHDASKDRSPIARIPYEAKRRYSYMYISH